MVTIRELDARLQRRRRGKVKRTRKRILAYTNLGDGEVDTPDYRSYCETKYDRNQELETFPKKKW